MPRFDRPSATSIGTAIYHRRRRDWKDDRDLIEEVAAAVNRLGGPYEYYDQGVFQFREKVRKFRKSGYENNKDVFHLGHWIRGRISELSKNQTSYDLRVHTLPFPHNLDDIIGSLEKKGSDSKLTKNNVSNLETLFPDPSMRNFVMERMEVLHHGNLVAYLSSLVAKERESLLTNSASIMDLIHICELKLSVLKLEVTKKYSAGETDLWIPSISLGVEIRNSWDPEDEVALLRTLSDTNFRLQSRHLVVVVSDGMGEEAFESMRKIEKRKVIENLSIIRVGDFENYVLRIMEIEKK
jgi:hypothetical protein